MKGRKKILVILSMFLLFLAISACDSDNGEDLPDDADSTPPTGQASESPFPLPVLHVLDSGFSQVIASDFPESPGTDIGSGFLSCETDASVQIQNGVAIGITAAPESFHADKGETIFSEEDTPMDTEDNTLLDLPVYRNDDGQLILGWRHCEDAYPSSTPQ